MAKKRKAKRPTKADLPEELIEVTSVRMTSFQAENVLRVKALRLDLDKLGNVVTIEGRNEAGKSSALKGIEMSIAGAGVIPADPIHDDHGEGKVISRFDIERPVDIDRPELGVEKFGQLVATRDFKRGMPPKLTVRIHGQKRALERPQVIFDILMDHIALDPLQFQKMPDEQKQQILAELAGLDLAPINSKRKGLFDERTEVNRDVKRLEAEHEATTFHKDAPSEEVSVSALMGELKDKQTHNAVIAKAFARVDEIQRTLDAHVKSHEEAVTDIEHIHAELKKRMQDREAAANAVRQVTEQRQTQADHAVGFEPADEDATRKRIDTADSINLMVRDNAKHAKTAEAFEAATSEADDLSAQIEQLDADKKQMLIDAESRLPVKGLGFNDEGVVTYKGKPFSQAGKSATAVVSCGVSIKLNEDKMLKILSIDDAEKMDGPTKRKVAEMGVAKGFQIFMAQVMPDAGPSEGAVIIEDGELKA